MLINSPLFFKAVSIIAKQRALPDNGSTSLVSANNASASSSKEKMKDNSTGMFSFSNTFSQVQFIYSDALATFLNRTDIDYVSRARDVVANSIMAELAKEDPQGDSEFQDAVRHQIVGIFQRLRLLLLVLDTLMEAYNASK